MKPRQAKLKPVKIHFIASHAPEAKAALTTLVKRYGQTPSSRASVIVALGGDGLMLRTLHNHMNARIPIYGMNRGSVGFLMNDFRADGLLERLSCTETTTIHPLLMTATDKQGRKHAARAINEVALLRQTHQTAKLKISVDRKVRLPEMICDGILLATPAGSTAYNLSAHGPILPISSSLLALTPLSVFRPRRWRGALLRNLAEVKIDVLEPASRPVSATADHMEVRHVTQVSIRLDTKTSIPLLFDAGQSLDERILREQFFY